LYSIDRSCYLPEEWPGKCTRSDGMDSLPSDTSAMQRLKRSTANTDTVRVTNKKSHPVKRGDI
jgi:hypothetical protein